MWGLTNTVITWLSSNDHGRPALDLGWPFNLVWICEFREIDGVGIALNDHNFVLVYCCLLLLFASMLYFGRFVCLLRRCCISAKLCIELYMFDIVLGMCLWGWFGMFLSRHNQKHTTTEKQERDWIMTRFDSGQALCFACGRLNYDALIAIYFGSASRVLTNANEQHA